MRIVSGTHKGRVIRPPAFFKARPTTDMAKESLFNILLNRFDFEDCDVLDLFSGTGSISYEFASRGANKIVSIEKNFKYVQFIKKTAEGFGFDQLTALKADSFKFVEKTLAKFDLIFADPPYDLQELETVPGLVFEHGLLKEAGLLIVEHPASVSFARHPNFVEVRNYSRVHFSFFENATNSDNK